MNQQDLPAVSKAEQTAMLVSIALRLVSQRLVTVLVLLLNTGIFGWAMFTESWPRIAAAAIFAVASWCLVYLRPKEVSNEA